MDAINAADLKIDIDQGEDDSGRTLGYVRTDREDDGGYFFTWMETTDETVDSLAADDVDPPTFPVEVAAEFLRDRIAILALLPTDNHVHPEERI